ncbi:MAG: glycosyl hydrolase family 65 protein [Planctomycetota bacterium]
MPDSWSIVQSPFEIETARAYEGLFTLGSGYLHVRGSLEEHLADAPQNKAYVRKLANVTSETFAQSKLKWGTYVPGVFGPHPLLGSEMINLPFFLGWEPIVDGEKLDVESGLVDDYQCVLRLDTATLERSLRWRTRSGRALRVVFERFVSGARPHLCCQRLTLVAETDTKIAIRTALDADVRTNGHDHFQTVELEKVGDAGIRCRVTTDGGDVVHIESRLKAQGNGRRFEASSRTAALITDLGMIVGETLTIEKRTAVTTSRDLQPTNPAEQLADAGGMPFDELHAEHAAWWRRRWERCDVIIAGDDDSQRAIRASLYHLLRVHVADDPRVAIDAKGYSGEAYWGRYFWDTELFLLPFYLYTDPERARTLVDFRVQSLDGGRANARRYGYDGARYAWESDPSGLECCLNWQYADHEVHITADVVYGLVHYARAVGDQAYLDGPAAQVLVETARYWLQRLDRRAGDDHLSLLGVMGPDEYTPISSNNAYTNRMVKFALEAAARHGAVGGASAAECGDFAAAARSLSIPRRESDALVLQCEEFESLAEPRFEKLWIDRSKTFAAHVSQERLYRTKCLKQADVLMLMMLFPHEFSDAEVRQAWDYYLPYTTHDSSLSAGVHAIVAARLGLDDEAWRFWLASTAIDLDMRHGGATEGIHIASAAANWLVIVQGFAGVKSALQSESLTLSPRLPARWTRLVFPLVWQGVRLRIDMTRNATTITNHSDRALSATVWGEEQSIGPAKSTTWGA